MVSPEMGYHLYESPIQQKPNGGAQHLRSNRGTEPRLLGRCCVLCLHKGAAVAETSSWMISVPRKKSYRPWQWQRSFYPCESANGRSFDCREYQSRQ